eukprot:TRINITY_DN17428_c0_g1_i1.p3 TRINITY_DN17428_c0_g1~~TRINITY_DN17428_c0_g1_i1.p3  ORF type:complete len:111 (-),score=12.31 TRINITY_DN17428_c0_g1_i1:515-847(-)
MCVFSFLCFFFYIFYISCCSFVLSCFNFFFFKQKTAYEMLRSLVGSEMCIRDRHRSGGCLMYSVGVRWVLCLEVMVLRVSGLGRLDIFEGGNTARGAITHLTLEGSTTVH